MSGGWATRLARWGLNGHQLSRAYQSEGQEGPAASEPSFKGGGDRHASGELRKAEPRFDYRTITRPLFVFH